VDERNGELRNEVTAADDTGLVAGEEVIAALHAALPHGHPAHATIDALHAEVGAAAPNRRTIERHVSNLRGLPELEAAVANWWDDPKTQRFIETLSRIGL
jgi:hypothetical protein